MPVPYCTRRYLTSPRPVTCEDLFERIKANNDNSTTSFVSSIGGLKNQISLLVVTVGTRVSAFRHDLISLRDIVKTPKSELDEAEFMEKVRIADVEKREQPV